MQFYLSLYTSINMIGQLLIILLPMISAAPIQFPLLELQGTMQQQQLALQEQMLAFQQFQALQMNSMPPVPMSVTQPLLILLPDKPTTTEENNRHTNLNNNALKRKPSDDIDDEDADDSITIDAEPQEIDDNVTGKNIPVKGILLVPNTARFSIGGIISSIPFLPIEINVPDSIAWMYNGIAGIISGIGQSWPFRPSRDNQRGNLKTIWKDFRKSDLPVVVIPLGHPMVPTF